MKEVLVDTSNETLGISLVNDGQLVANYEARGHRNHSIALMPMLVNLMEQAKWQPEDVDQFVIAKGPGSYTGLRIGMATLKTMAYTLHKPLKTVSSLEEIAQNIPQGVVISLFNARRNHVYVTAFKNGERLLEDQYLSLEEVMSFAQSLNETVVFNGDAVQFKEQILAEFPQAIVVEEEFLNLPHAYLMTQCTGEIYEGDAIHNVVPAYLKQVEAEEKWRETHEETAAEREAYIQTSK